MHGMHRYLPDAEEAQNVVYTIGVEVLCHLAEAAHPPRIAILLHHIPVVGREAPVLPVDREVIGWGTCLTVHVEVVWLFPSLHAATIDADRDVALQYHAQRTGIVGHGRELQVQVILYVVVERYLWIDGCAFCTQRLNLLLVVNSVLLPLAEIGCAVQIAQVAEGRVWLQPLLILLKEMLEILRGQSRLSILLEDEADILPLSFVHLLIIYLWQGVELLLQAFEAVGLLLILQCAQLLQIQIHGVESIDGDAAVRVGVHPGVGDVGIIDR